MGVGGDGSRCAGFLRKLPTQKFGANFGHRLTVHEVLVLGHHVQVGMRGLYFLSIVLEECALNSICFFCYFGPTLIFQLFEFLKFGTWMNRTNDSFWGFSCALGPEKPKHSNPE